MTYTSMPLLFKWKDGQLYEIDGLGEGKLGEDREVGRDGERQVGKEGANDSIPDGEICWVKEEVQWDSLKDSFSNEGKLPCILWLRLPQKLISDVVCVGTQKPPIELKSRQKRKGFSREDAAPNNHISYPQGKSFCFLWKTATQTSPRIESLGWGCYNVCKFELCGYVRFI